jgi:membrane protease YdiL (CAAX protease family)
MSANPSWSRRLVAAFFPPAPPVATQRRAPISARGAYLQIAVVYALTYGLSAATAMRYWVHPWAIANSATPALASELKGQVFGWLWQIPVCLSLTLWLAARRGWTLRRLGVRPTWAGSPLYRRQGVVAAATLIAAMIAAGEMLSRLTPRTAYPIGGTGPWGMVGAVASSMNAGIVEELVVVAFVVTTLRQARRPWLEIVLVALVLRALYHLYYSTWWTLLWVAIWGGAALALYWRTRRLTALILGHALFDFVYFTRAELHQLGDQLIDGAAVAGVVVVVSVRLIRLLLRRSRAAPASPLT